MTRFRLRALTIASLAVALVVAIFWMAAPRRLSVVVPDRIYRGAWQQPGTLESIVRDHGIKTVVTLTAITAQDEKYVGQAALVEKLGIGWIIVPMRGSRATMAQLAEAADLIADPKLQPVFFHCVAGHHRSGLVHAAYRIRREGWTADQAWAELCRLDWVRPNASADQQDLALIRQFAAGPFAQKETACAPSEDESSFSGLALRLR